MSDVKSLIPGVKTGDRIRVTIEGDVNDVSGEWVETNDFVFAESDTEIVAAEILPPPVEQFKPGDVIRHKGSGATYAIGAGGEILCIPSGAVLTNIPNWYKVEATSKTYERVSL